MLLVLSLLVAGMGKAAIDVFVKERGSEIERSAAEEKETLLLARRDALTKKIAGLKTREGIEAEIRAQFQVAKPGERMVVVLPDKETLVTTEPASSLLSRFFGIFR